MSQDEIVIKEIDTWKLYVSKSEKCLYINTTDYHPFPLKLSRADLQELLKSLEEIIQ